MTQLRRHRRKPTIIVSASDHSRLSQLASVVQDHAPELADELQAEMDRARVVPDRKLPDNVIRVGSTVEFRTDTGHQRRVTLVFPAEADIAEGRISILTPVGVALIGLSPGQSISWTARDGRQHELTILSVEQREPVVAG